MMVETKLAGGLRVRRELALAQVQVKDSDVKRCKQTKSVSSRPAITCTSSLVARLSHQQRMHSTVTLELCIRLHDIEPWSAAHSYSTVPGIGLAFWIHPDNPCLHLPIKHIVTQYGKPRPSFPDNARRIPVSFLNRIRIRLGSQ